MFNVSLVPLLIILITYSFTLSAAIVIADLYDFKLK